MFKIIKFILTFPFKVITVLAFPMMALFFIMDSKTYNEWKRDIKDFYKYVFSM